MLDFEQDFSGIGGALFDAQQDTAADHQFGEFARRGFRGGEGAHHGALAHHRDFIGDGHDLAQLVRDQDDGLALVAQRFQDAKEMIGLGRGENAGGLIENEDFGAAIQRLEDFDALLLADREILDDGIGIDLEAVIGGEALQLGAGLGEGAAKQHAVLGAEHDVFEHGEIVDQHEMLVHHADAEGERMAAVGDGVGGAVDADLARIGVVEAVEDRHQGRFAGAVFADDAMHRAGPDDQMDVTVGVHRPEMLVDANELDGRGECSGCLQPLH